MRAGQSRTQSGTVPSGSDQMRSGQAQGSGGSEQMRSEQARHEWSGDDDSRDQRGPGSGDSSRLLDETREAARQQANALWSDARHAARSKVSEQKESAAGHIGQFAAALRAAGQQLEGEKQSGAARLTETAAGGLDRLSSTLRDRDLDDMLREAESFARRQPLAFFAAAAVAGFVAVRFLKSSGDGQGDRRPADERNRYDTADNACSSFGETQRSSMQRAGDPSNHPAGITTSAADRASNDFRSS